MELIEIKPPRPLKTARDLNAGLVALTVPEEQAEVLAVLNGKGDRMTPTQVVEAARRNGVTLVYLERSQEMGLALFNVMAPQVAGYRYTPDSGFPTFSLDTLREKGLVPWF